jgi:3-oxoacyl-[acyl-carrier-protein] synthase III
MDQIVRKVKIIGTGSYVPGKIYSNEYLESIVDTNADWIFNNLGIKERRIASEDESTSDLATKAGMAAIEASKIGVDEIELIIVATATPDRLAPSTACFVQDNLKAYNAVCFDLNAVCSGFLFSMSVACQYIASGVYNNVLVIGADTFSKITDWASRDSVFFGDGAGAVVLSHASGKEAFLAYRLYSDGRGKYSFTIPAGGSEMPSSIDTVTKRLHYFQMDGKKVYDTAIKVLPQAISKVLEDTGLEISDIDYMIPHQPSIKVLRKTAEILGLPFEKVYTNMDRYANTSAGTIPILLDEMNRAKKLKTGNIILFAAVGSGWTYGASIIKWS